MKKTSPRYIALMAMFITISLMLSYVETLIPAIPIPGAKIGLPNIITLLVLLTLGFKNAFVVLIIRATISTLLFSSLLSLAYSLTGGIISLIMMFLLIKFFENKMSIIAISILGAITHNLAQLVVAILILETISIATLLPWLVIIAIPAGIVVGLSVRYSKKMFNQILNQRV